MEVPTLAVQDVNFGYFTVLHYFSNMEEIVENYVFNSREEKNIVKVLNTIRKFGEEGLTRTELYKRTRSISKRDRDAIVQELIDTEQVLLDQRVEDGVSRTIIRIN